MSEQRQITKRTGIIGGLTLVSRVSGLVRDAVIAFFFGTAAAADAFYMAFTIPNLLRRLFAEGALTISFVPIFSAELKQSRESAKILSDQAFSYLTLLLVLLCAAGIYFSPSIVKVIAAGFADDPDQFSLTIKLTQLCFPYLIFVSLAALAMGLLNSLKKFASPAAAPIFLNLGLIGGAVVSLWVEPPVYGLALGVLVGGLMQLSIQLPDVRRLGFFPRINFNVHPELKSLLGLMLPAAYGAAVYQLNVIVIRFFASYLPTGAVSYLWYANRLFEFPMGVFAIALATAIQPTLSDYSAKKNWEKFKETLNYGLRLNFFITIPAMVGLIVLAHPIVRVLLQRGAFDPIAALGTAEAMIAFAVGLPFLGLVRLIVPAFYAIKDSKTPVVMATAAVLVNIVLSWWWVKLWGHIGLALAVSASSVVNALGLSLWMRRKLGQLGGRNMARVLIQSALAAGAMGFILWWPQAKEIWLETGQSLWLQGIELLLSVGAGIIVFFLVAKFLGCQEASDALKNLRRLWVGVIAK